MEGRPDLFERVLAGRAGEEVYPESMKVVKYFRSTAKFREIVQSKMSLGSERMMDLGNLYTAALPAWIAAGFEEALETGRDVAGKDFLAVGYGSGDAADAFVITGGEKWKEAAAKIGFSRSLGNPFDLTREQYEALHDGKPLAAPIPIPRGELAVDRIGELGEGELQDIGIEYYKYCPDR